MNKIIKQYHWLIKQLWIKKRTVLIICMITSLFGSTLGFFLSYAQKLLIHHVQINYGMNLLILLILILYVTITFIKSIYGFIDSYFAHKLVQTSTYIFNKFYTYKIYKEDQVKFYQPEFNDWIQKVNMGLKIVPYQILQINELLFYVFMVFCIEIPIFLYYAPILLCFLFIGVIYKRFVFPKLAMKKYEFTQELVREQRKVDYFGETLITKKYAKEMRVFHLKDYLLNKYRNSFFKVAKSKEAFDVKQAKYHMIGNCIDMFLYCLVLLYLLYELFTQKLNLSTFVFLYSLYSNCNEMLMTVVKTSFSDLYENYYNIKNYHDYVIDILEFEKKGPSSEVTLPCGEFKELQVKNVSFRYPNSERNAVDQVSFSVKKGEIVSILGYNGSGKTTLSKLLTGLYEPMSGEIYINGNNIKKYSKEQVYEYYGVAYQDFTRYCLTLEDNIQIGYVEKKSESKVKESIDKSGLDMKKTGIEYATILGKIYDKNGIDLSGGEWQRIALARAYMGEHEVIILDEPTASIDAIQEMKMLADLKKILKNETGILISHRIGFARLADKIIFMENGKIEEVGSHEALLAKNGKYSKIFQAQKELYNF